MFRSNSANDCFYLLDSNISPQLFARPFRHMLSLLLLICMFLYKVNVFFKLCNLYVFDIVAGSFLITCANLVCYLKHFEHETQHIFLNWSAGGWRCPRSGVRASLLCYLANILCSVFWETLWWQPSTMRTRSRPKWMVFR